MIREELHTFMMRAHTLEQCATAWKAQEAWLRLHHDDESVIEEGEALWMTEQALPPKPCSDLKREGCRGSALETISKRGSVPSAEIGNMPLLAF